MDVKPVFSRLAASIPHAVDFDSGSLYLCADGKYLPHELFPGKKASPADPARLPGLFQTRNGSFRVKTGDLSLADLAGWTLAVTIFNHGRPAGAVAVSRMEPFTEEEEMGLNAAVALTVLEVDRLRFFQNLHSNTAFDDVTDFFNNRVFQRSLLAHFTEWKRYGNPFSVILFTVDGFRTLQETHGEKTAMRVLKIVSKEMKEITRKSDWTFKVGLGEFILILPATPAAQAVQFCRRLKERVEAGSASTDMGEKLPISLSMGVVQAGADMDNTAALMRQLDSAVFASRQRGGGRITFCDQGKEDLKPAEEAAASA